MNTVINSRLVQYKKQCLIQYVYINYNFSLGLHIYNLNLIGLAYYMPSLVNYCMALPVLSKNLF